MESVAQFETMDEDSIKSSVNKYDIQSYKEYYENYENYGDSVRGDGGYQEQDQYGQHHYNTNPDQYGGGIRH